MTRMVAREPPRGGPAPGRATGPGGGPGGWRLHAPVLALLALGGGIGLVLWGKWGFLVAFDAIRTYCF